MDGGYTLGKEAYALGADIVTVCAAADPDCIAGPGARGAGGGEGILGRPHRHRAAELSRLCGGRQRQRGGLCVCAPVRAAVPGNEPGIYARKDANRLGRQGGVCAQARAVGRADDGIPAGDPGMLPAPCQPGRCVLPAPRTRCALPKLFLRHENFMPHYMLAPR